MTQSIENNGRTYHQCVECKLLYGKKKLAKECEAWCREHKTCNTEIIKHAITIVDTSPSSRKPEVMATKRGERLAERERVERRRKLVRFAKRSSVMAASAVAIGFLGWYLATRPPVPEGEIISQNGLHWHPELTIYINGEKEDIPANIGIGITHNPIHTHDTDNVIHLEFQGLVRKDDLQLAQFFKVWGKAFNRDQISDYRNGADGKIAMLVNGEPNDQFENYIMQDKDKIEIRYEK